MARITVEDCLKNVKNRFKLVLVASRRARQIATGGKEPYVDWENDKASVVALREIAEGYVDHSILDTKPEYQPPAFQNQGSCFDQADHDRPSNNVPLTGMGASNTSNPLDFP